MATEIKAIDYTTSVGVEVGNPHNQTPYGDDVVHNAYPYQQQYNMVEYDFKLTKEGDHDLYVQYAADDPRPTRVLINGHPVREAALAELTGGWLPENQKWILLGTFAFRNGENKIRLERNGVLPHLHSLKIEEHE